MRLIPFMILGIGICILLLAATMPPLPEKKA